MSRRQLVSAKSIVLALNLTRIIRFDKVLFLFLRQRLRLIWQKKISPDTRYMCRSSEWFDCCIFWEDLLLKVCVFVSMIIGFKEQLGISRDWTSYAA